MEGVSRQFVLLQDIGVSRLGCPRCKTAQLGNCYRIFRLARPQPSLSPPGDHIIFHYPTIRPRILLRSDSDRSTSLGIVYCAAHQQSFTLRAKGIMSQLGSIQVADLHRQKGHSPLNRPNSNLRRHRLRRMKGGQGGGRKRAATKAERVTGNMVMKGGKSI